MTSESVWLDSNELTSESDSESFSLESIDLNQDGVVDECEFLAAGGSKQEFDQYDVDKDGVLDATELRARDRGKVTHHADPNELQMDSQQDGVRKKREDASAPSSATGQSNCPVARASNRNSKSIPTTIGVQPVEKPSKLSRKERMQQEQELAQERARMLQTSQAVKKAAPKQIQLRGSLKDFSPQAATSIAPTPSYGVPPGFFDRAVDAAGCGVKPELATSEAQVPKQIYRDTSTSSSSDTEPEMRPRAASLQPIDLIGTIKKCSQELTQFQAHGNTMRVQSSASSAIHTKLDSLTQLLNQRQELYQKIIR